MRILIVGDLHGDLEWLALKVIPVAVIQRCDTIMQVGDFGFVWSTERSQVDADLAELNQLLDTHARTLCFLPGNHENHPMLSRLAREAPRSPAGHFMLTERVHYTGRIARWTWGATTIAAVGCATSIDRALRTPGESWWPEEALTATEAQVAMRQGPVDVLFTHDGPLGVPFSPIANVESAAHRMLIGDVARALRPGRWWHGHYHQFAQYEFRHDAGTCAVTALDCNRADPRHAMAVVDLD